jgi:hypothetical protein
METGTGATWAGFGVGSSHSPNEGYAGMPFYGGCGFGAGGGSLTLY